MPAFSSANGIEGRGLLHKIAAFVLMLIRALLGTILLASVLLICANAFARYVLLSPIIWAEEVLGFALVWIVYLGAVQVTREDGHLSMDLITQSLAPRWRKAVKIVGSLVFLAICALIIYQSFDSIAQFTQVSQIAGLPMNVLHMVIPVSFGLMFLLVLAQGVVELVAPAEALERSEPSGMPPQ